MTSIAANLIPITRPLTKPTGGWEDRQHPLWKMLDTALRVFIWLCLGAADLCDQQRPVGSNRLAAVPVGAG